MARVAEGWKLKWKRGIAHVVFTHPAKQRNEISTRSRDPGEASRIAAQIYSDVISGRVRRNAGGTLTHPETLLVDLISVWLVDIEPEIARDTLDTYTMYGRKWIARWGSLGRLMLQGEPQAYARVRLGSVERETVCKELSGLRRFVRWLAERGHIAEVPKIPDPPAKALGTSHPQGRRAPVAITLAQCEAVIAATSELTKRIQDRKWPVRDYFAFCYETGLRPATVKALRESDLLPDGRLHIRAEIDKNRRERFIPLSSAALAALQCNAVGDPDRLIFGRVSRRKAWIAASKAALGDALAKRVTPYCLKHARISAWLSAGMDPLGVQWLTGTERAMVAYAIPTYGAGERVIKLFGANLGPASELNSISGVSDGDRTRDNRSHKVVDFLKLRESEALSAQETGRIEQRIALSGARPQKGRK